MRDAASGISSRSRARPSSETIPPGANSSSLMSPRAARSISPRVIWMWNACSSLKTMSRKSSDSAPRSAIRIDSSRTSDAGRASASAGADQLGEQVWVLPVLRHDDRSCGLERLAEEVAISAEVLGVMRTPDDVLHRLGPAADRADQRGTEGRRGNDREAPRLAVRARWRGDCGIEKPFQQRAIDRSPGEDADAAAAAKPIEVCRTVHSSLNPPSTFHTWPVT